MAPSPSSAPRVPDYELLRRIGGGSYGDVWLARGVTGVYRAVKIVARSRFDSPRPYQRELDGITRFQRHAFGKARQLALLHVGLNEAEGFFFYVMELADDLHRGTEIDPATYEPLTLKERLLEKGRLSADEALRLAVDLTSALGELHGLGLIHRDIKPSNLIYVGGRPKIADVGLVSSAEVTLTSVGTPGYESPEGPGSKPADQFSLGKVLYVASTGMAPAEFPRLPPELIGWPDATKVFELNEVITRACSYRPSERYPDLGAMMADLRLIEAGRSLKELSTLRRRWRRAARWGSWAAVILVLALIFLWQESRSNRRLAQQQTEARIRSERQERETRQAWYQSELNRAQLALQIGDLGVARQALRSAATSVDPPQRGFEWEALQQLAQGDSNRWVQVGIGPNTEAALSPDGRRLAVLEDSQELRVWEEGNPAPLAFVPGVWRLGGFSSDGQRVSLSTQDRRFGWRTVPGGTSEWMPGRGTLAGLWGSPERVLVVSPPDEPLSVHWWDLEARAERAQFQIPAEWSGWSVSGMATTSDARRLAVSFFDERSPQWKRALVVWDIPSGKELWRDASVERVGSMAFSPNHRALAVGLAGQGVRLYPEAGGETATSAGAFSLMGPLGQTWTLAFSPTGDRLVSAGEDRVLRLWDLASRRPVRNWLGHEQSIRSVAWTADGAALVSASEDRTSRVWPLTGQQGVVRATGFWADPLGGMALLDARDQVAVTDQTGIVTVVDLTSGKRRGVLTNAFLPLGTAGTNSQLWALSAEWNLQRWDTRERRLVEQGPKLLEGVAPLVIASSEATPRVAFGFSEGGLRVFDPLATLRLRVTEAVTNSAVWSVALSAEGNWIAGGSEDGRIQLWPVTGGAPRILDADPGQGRVSAAAFAPQGQWVVAGWASGRIAAYRWPSQDKIGSWQAHSGSVRALAFSPDGTRLVTGGNEGTVVFWELPGFRRLTSLVIPPNESGNQDSGVSQLAFDRLGRWLVVLTEDGRLVAWRGSP